MIDVKGTLDDRELSFQHDIGSSYKAKTSIDEDKKGHLAVITATDEAGNVATESMVIAVSASWSQPKTDWHGETDADGVYHGDRFNTEDFNRIKNNLEYIREVAVCQYPDFGINDLGEDREKHQFFYADEINALEENIDAICKNTVGFHYGEPEVYYDNGPIFDFNELNRIEGAILDMHDQLTNQYRGRRKLAFSLGGGTEAF